MIILKIIGWFILISAGGSFVYSTFFHLFGYLRMKKRLRTDEGSETYKELSGKINWGIIIFFQILKLTLVAVLLYFLL